MSKKWLAVFGAVASLSAHAFTPLPGTWIINSELNGKPGRGLAIDVQNGTVVMQVYGYESNGSPTFYMGTSTSYANNVATIPLKQYQGGRYLGSGDRSATELKSLGNATLTFADATSGTISLPGEQTVAMSRFDFSGYGPNDPQSLLGVWVLTGTINGGGQGSPVADWVFLTQITGGKTSWGSGTVRSDDNLVDCEHDVSGNNPGWTQCDVYDGPSSTAKLLRSYVFKWLFNAGEGSTYINNQYVGAAYALRSRDKNNQYVGFLRATSEKSAIDNEDSSTSPQSPAQPTANTTTSRSN